MDIGKSGVKKYLMASKQGSELCGERLKILADPTRLSVALELLKGPKSVTELQDFTRIPQSLLSHHLAVLRKAGLVTTAREGKSILYSASENIRSVGAQKMIDLGCCKLDFGAQSLK